MTFMSRGRPLKRNGEKAERQPMTAKQMIQDARRRRRLKRQARLQKQFIRLAVNMPKE